MPTYEYKCDACGTTFEKFQSMSSAPVKTCPSCKKPKVKRLIGTGAGLIFKGSGFYITDYRSESYKKAAEGDSGKKPADAAATSADAKPDTTSAESKPATNKPADTTKPAAAEAKPAAPKESKSTKKK